MGHGILSVRGRGGGADAVHHSTLAAPRSSRDGLDRDDHLRGGYRPLVAGQSLRAGPSVVAGAVRLLRDGRRRGARISLVRRLSGRTDVVRYRGDRRDGYLHFHPRAQTQAGATSPARPADLGDLSPG